MTRSLAVRCAIMLAYALIAYGLIFWQGQTNSDRLQTYVLSALALYFAFGMGVAGQLVFDWKLQLPFRAVFFRASFIVFLACVILVAVRYETVICVIMILPIGLLVIAAGISTARNLLRAFDKPRTFAVALLLLPFALAQTDPTVLLPEREFAVSTEIIIAADATEVWALVQNVSEILDSERPVTLTHNLMMAPRPLSAETIDGVRYARWTKGVTFEEVIFESVPGRSLGWLFRFPDLEAMHALDYRVSPIGPEVVMRTGRYSFEQLTGGETKVVLTTTYDLKTPLNVYFATWGYLFLNDFHIAVLDVLKARAEG